MIVGVPIGISLGIAAMAALGYGGVVDSSHLAQSLVTSIDSLPADGGALFIPRRRPHGPRRHPRRLLEVGEILFGCYTRRLLAWSPWPPACSSPRSRAGPATVAAIGGILFPAMLRRIYDRNFSVGLVASAGLHRRGDSAQHPDGDLRHLLRRLGVQPLPRGGRPGCADRRGADADELVHRAQGRLPRHRAQLHRRRIFPHPVGRQSGRCWCR